MDTFADVIPTILLVAMFLPLVFERELFAKKMAKKKAERRARKKRVAQRLKGY